MEIISFENLNFTCIGWEIATPLLLIILDVITGIVIAWKTNTFRSSKMRNGLAKKYGELVYIIIGILTKFALNTNLLLYFTVSYICFMEISSLFENCDKLGIKIPNKIKEKLNNESEEK